MLTHRHLQGPEYLKANSLLLLKYGRIAALYRDGCRYEDMEPDG